MVTPGVKPCIKFANCLDQVHASHMATSQAGTGSAGVHMRAATAIPADSIAGAESGRRAELS